MCIWPKVILLKDLNRKPLFGIFPLGNSEPKASSNDKLVAVFFEALAHVNFFVVLVPNLKKLKS